MAIKVIFGGKTIQEPGVYAQVKSGVKNPPLNLDYGIVLLIDTGSGASYGGYAINGEITSGSNAIKFYSAIDDFKADLRGGEYSYIADYLFQPNGFGTNGASQVGYVRACTAAPAEVTYEFGAAGAVADFTIQSRLEGLIGNGVNSTITTKLKKGYAVQMKAGPNANTTTPDTFVLEFTVGTFAGLDTEGDPYFNETEANSAPEVILTSIEFTKASDLGDWMRTSSAFNTYFKLDPASTFTTSNVVNADLTANATIKLFAGGTETYNASDFDLVLDAIKETYYNFVMTDNYGVAVNGGGKSSNNTKLFNHLLTQAKYRKMMFVAGGQNEDEFTGSTGSIGIANFYNHSSAVVVHGGFYKTSRTGVQKKYSSFVKAAAVLGRIAGAAPQVPGTFKGLNWDGEVHLMTEKERILALNNGVLHTKFDTEFNRYTINQSINTLAGIKNEFFINPDGQSYEISVTRIGMHLCNLLMIRAKQDLLSQEDGVNRFTLSASSLAEYTKGFLQLQTATDNTDGLILRFEQITIKTYLDSYFINFGYEPNYPVNKLFFTGFQLDSSLQ